MISICNCKSEFQDRMYGAGRRVHNETDETRANHKMRCTICGTQKESTKQKSKGKPIGK